MSSCLPCARGRSAPAAALPSAVSKCLLSLALLVVSLWGLRPAALEAQVLPDCPLPEPGTQTTMSRASVEVLLPTGVPETVELSGESSIAHGAPGREGMIPIEILSMSLTGTSSFGPVHLRESPTLASTGVASNIQCLAGPDGSLVPYVDSFFDVFVEIDLPAPVGVLHNVQPIRMQTRKPVPLDHRLPGVELFQIVGANPVMLLDANDRATGIRVVNTRHELIPPTNPCFPPAGKDVMDSVLLHDIDIPGIGLCQANLSGPVTVQRSAPYVDPTTGLQCIDTEIIEMNLQGSDPLCGRINITLSPFRKSRGRICEKFPGTCFPANSYFDVYIKVELPDLGICLYACQPAHMECMIDTIPPFGCLYNLNIGAGNVIPLYPGPCAGGADPCALQPLPAPAAFIVKAVHQPLPPKVCACFPKAGEDALVTTLVHQIDIPGLQLSCSQFTGPIVIRRGDPYINEQGLCCIKTEVVKLEMTGTCSNGATATIRLCPDRRSTGLICAKERGTCFPANSCFEIFFEIEVTLPTGGTVKLKNCRPAIMCCMIDALPPIGCPYGLQNGPIELYRVPADGSRPCAQTPLPIPDGILRDATHTPDKPTEPCCPEYGPGRDVLQTQLMPEIDIPGIGRCTANLAGPIVVERGTPYQDPASGLCCVETRIASMDLRGVDPICGRICISLDPRRVSKGTICSKERGSCFPANSCFDVFVRIELKDLGIVLVTCKPARMCCMIDAVPPYGCAFQLELGPGDTVPLYQEQATRVIGAGGGGGAPTTCTLPDNGTGTVDLPPASCGYVSPDDVHMIIDGLPAGTTIRIGVEHFEFFGITRGPGGSLGGELERFSSVLRLDLQGTGALGAFTRNLIMGNVQSETHVAPRTPGAPVQSFDTDMFLLQGQLPPGDPDFDLLRITAGTGFGLPSPGHTTLTQLPGGNWAVDSFFDITYRIDFVGRPGGPLGGRSGSTTGTIRMATGGGGGGQPEDPCAQSPLPNPRALIIKSVLTPNPPCACYPPAGEDTMQSELSHRVRVFGLGPGGTDIVCDANMAGPMTVRRSAPRVDPATGLCCIETEIVSMELRGNDPVCGEVIIRESPTRPSRGRICEKSPGTCFPANSFFDVFVEVEIPSLGVRLSNCGPTRMECMIDAIPPLNCVYQLNLSEVPLYRPDQCALLPSPNIRPTGVIERALHVPRQPCNCEYGPGIDTMDSTLSHDIVIFGLGGNNQLCASPMRGIVEVERGVPYTTADGLCCVTTRMRKLDLAGVDPVCGPVRIRLCPERPSRGTICQMMAGACFPATSCFEVFIEVEVMGMVLKNCEPALMCCKIDRLPPYNCVYQLNLGNALPLFRKGDCGPNATALGEIRAAQHVPKPCGPVGIRCDRQADGSVIITTTDDPNCPCEGRTIITRSVDGGPAVRIATAPAGAITVDPCEGLTPGPHTITYCAKCVLPDGTESVEVCCSIEVNCEPPPPGDCIRQGSVTCKVVDGKVVLDWSYVDPNCRCERVEITLNGAVIGTVAGDVTTFTTEKCEPGRYCVQCVQPDGTLGALHCCTLPECPTDCPVDCIDTVACTATTSGAVITWTYKPGCRCARIEIVRREAGAVVPIAVVDGTLTSFTIDPCRDGEYCIRCVCADGTTHPFHCCTVVCPPPPVGGCQKPNDCNQDGNLDISDALCLLGYLFSGVPPRLPCADGKATDAANLQLLDDNGDGKIDLSDVIYKLTYLFLGGPPPRMCIDPRCEGCIRIPGCPDKCTSCRE